MQRINVNLYPSGGYFFKESDGSMQRGKNWKEVITKVSAYRKRAGLPQGDPQTEVISQACQRNPAHCSNGQKSVPPPPKSFKSVVLAWLGSIFREKTRLQYVSAQEAQVRSDICAKCSENKAIGDVGCASCKASFKTYRDEVLGGARKRDGRLQGCGILGADLRTAVHLDEIRLDNGALPAHCWRKKVL